MMADPATRLHPQAAALLADMAARPGRPTPELARAGHEALSRRLIPPGPDMATVETLAFPVPGSAEPVAVRRYVPAGRPSRAIVYLHGGGWVIGTLETYDALCRELADRAKAQVFSVGYRLAPEARYPAPLDDCEAAFRAVAADAARFGVDPARIVLAGDSAGGHLAVGVARRLRTGEAAACGLVLVYPVADVGLDTPSMHEFAEGYYLSRELMRWFWREYLGDDPASHAGDPALAPLRAADLAELPPTLVLTAECDVLRDEGEALAARIVEQGGTCDLVRFDGMLHGFIRFPRRIDAAGEAIALVAERVAILTA
jgi:acetyl esterase